MTVAWDQKPSPSGWAEFGPRSFADESHSKMLSPRIPYRAVGQSVFYSVQRNHRATRRRGVQAASVGTELQADKNF